jgi:hypothetical protein
MTNKRNTEMAKKAAVLGLFGLLVVIIIGIALAVYFGTQKTQATDELPEDLGPQIKVDSLSAKYNPAPEEAVEGYTIEGYAAEGDINYTELSKSVDMTINWFNQSGFQNINELVIKRYVGDNVKATKTLKKSNSSESKYFESFSDLLTYTFEGKDVTYSVIGVNKIKIFYKNASNQEVELTPSDLDGVEVKKEQLAQTLDMVSPVTVEYKPSTSGEITVNPDIDRKGYFMYPGGSNLSIQEYIKVGTPHGKVFLVPSGTKNTTVKIKLEQDGTFIKYENNTFSFDSSNGTEFTLVKGEIDGTLRLKTSDDRFVAVKDDKLVMLKIDEITTREIYKTLDTTVTETPVQKQDCVFQWEEGTVNKSTGKRTDTYKLITKAGGGGKACEYTDGYKKEVDVPVKCEGGWNDWGDCSKTCGGGTRTRTWNTTIEPRNGGAACPATQTQSCNTQSCQTCKPNDTLIAFADEYNISPGGLYNCSQHKNESDCEAAGGDFTGYNSWDLACDWK